MLSREVCEKCPQFMFLSDDFLQVESTDASTGATNWVSPAWTCIMIRKVVCTRFEPPVGCPREFEHGIASALKREESSDG